MKKPGSLVALVVALCFTVSPLKARDQIGIVGSSTVYPFAAVVAEHFGRDTEFKTPKIESTGSGGGIKLFCEGLGYRTPDIVNSSRRIKQSEVDRCSKRGVRKIMEVAFGYDGIVVARSKAGVDFPLTFRTLYLSLAKDIPAPGEEKSFIPNPNKKWSDISPDLPDIKIRVLGPPTTSGTRDAFVELAMEGGCNTFPSVRELKKQDKALYKVRCHTLREDGAFIDAGENDNLLVQKLRVSPETLGIFGFSFLSQNADLVNGLSVEGERPTLEAAASGEYPLSRLLFFYVKKDHISIVPGLKEYVQAFISDGASGDDGYLVYRGLIPLSAQLRKENKEAVSRQQILTDLQ